MNPITKKNILILTTFAIPVIAVMTWSLMEVYRQIRVADALKSDPAAIVAKMSLDEKVGQLIHVGMSGKQMSDSMKKLIEEQKPGGVILFAHNLGTPEQIKKLNDDLQTISLKNTGLPLFISIDQEGGRVYRVGEQGATQLPSAMAIGQSRNEQYAHDAGFVTGYELRKLGFNLILAPVLDVNNNPANPVINTRSFGSRARSVANLGWSLAEGISDAMSTHCIKHFPGHGDTSVDSHLDLPVVNKSKSDLEDTELLPFRYAVRNGAEMVMSAHIMFPKIDKKYPVTLSKTILTGILRKEMGFEGPITTDAMEMNAISRNYSDDRAAKLAFKAGADIILLTAQSQVSRVMFESLINGFKSGELSVKDLDRAVERQIALKLKKGLFFIHDAKRPTHELLDDHFREKLAKTDEAYNKLADTYENGVTGLNRTVSRAGIASLRKVYEGIDRKQIKNVFIYFRSKDAKDAAFEYGVPENHIRSNTGWNKLHSEIGNMRTESIVLVEITASDIGQWNELVSHQPEDPGPTLIGYTYDNPFLDYAIPERGAVLVSFSPTADSKRAVIYRALQGQVEKADIVLPEINSEGNP